MRTLSFITHKKCENHQSRQKREESTWGFGNVIYHEEKSIHLYLQSADNRRQKTTPEWRKISGTFLYSFPVYSLSQLE